MPERGTSNPEAVREKYKELIQREIENALSAIDIMNDDSSSLFDLNFLRKISLLADESLAEGATGRNAILLEDATKFVEEYLLSKQMSFDKERWMNELLHVAGA